MRTVPMTPSRFSFLDEFRTLGDREIPAPVLERADGRPVELAWRNEAGGLTFEVDGEHVKWSPRASGIDLDRERIRLEWIADRHPAPRVVAWGEDDVAQWFVTGSLPGQSAVSPEWQPRAREAMHAIATGLRTLHSIPIDDVPDEWAHDSWINRTPESLGARPPVDEPVLVHGDACAPNTLIGPDGRWAGNVDFGDLGIGDRWADLAVASMSLGWNFGDGLEDEFFAAYGIEPDAERIHYYRELWRLES